MGGNTSSGVASGMQSVETHVQLSFGWTHEELWLRVSRKSVVAVPMEAAPRARSSRVRGHSTFNRMRQPQTNFIYFIWRKLLERKSFIPISSVHRSFELPFDAADFKSQLFNKQFSISDFYAQYIDELKLSALRALSQLRSSPRSQAAKFRIEKDPRRSWCHQYSRPFSKFEFSHLFLRCWPVLVSPTPGEQKRWRLFSIWTAIISRNRRCTQAKRILFSRRSQRKPLQAARMSFEPANLFTCDSNYLIYFIQSIHAETPFLSEPSTPGDSTLAILAAIYYLFYRRNRSLV